ncbi:Presenilin-1 [Trichinella pseudospiralis]
MSTRRRDHESEEEQAQNDRRRTGADPEETNQPTPPGRVDDDEAGSINLKNTKRVPVVLDRIPFCVLAKSTEIKKG